MRKALEGFIVDDRRGERHDTQEPDGVEIVERDDRGAECVYVVRDGRKKLIRRAGHDVEHLDHRFPVCPECKTEHLVVGDDDIQCPRIGWGWQASQGLPGYTSGARTFTRATKMEPDPVAESQRHHNLEGLAREIKRRGGDV